MKWDGASLRPLWSEQVGLELYDHSKDNGTGELSFSQSEQPNPTHSHSHSPAHPIHRASPMSGQHHDSTTAR